MRILDWIKYETEYWNEKHEKLAMEIAKKLIWYRPGIRKRIIKEVEEGLNHVKEKEDQEKVDITKSGRMIMPSKNEKEKEDG